VTSAQTRPDITGRADPTLNFFGPCRNWAVLFFRDSGRPIRPGPNIHLYRRTRTGRALAVVSNQCRTGRRGREADSSGRLLVTLNAQRPSGEKNAAGAALKPSACTRTRTRTYHVPEVMLCPVDSIGILPNKMDQSCYVHACIAC
jgi:hypothetical protein